MFSSKRKKNKHTNDKGGNHAAGRSVEGVVAEKPLTRHTLKMLGITVLLSQLPLLLHLPLWLTLPGIGLVFAKMRMGQQTKPLLPPTLTIVFVLLSVIAVFAHYGYLFGRDPCVAFLFLLLSFKYVETKHSSFSDNHWYPPFFVYRQCISSDLRCLYCNEGPSKPIQEPWYTLLPNCFCRRYRSH